jgi:hypothetical protein
MSAQPAASSAGPYTPPPIDEGEMLVSIRRRIAALGLDLTGLVVATEAATGAYAATAVIAALAGAREVIAIGKDTARHGTFEDAVAAVTALAQRAGVLDRITFCRCFGEGTLERCDIITNSGAVRPITREMIERLPKHAVLAMMFEAWEYRPADFELDACRKNGIRITAVNERHPSVGVFDFLGPLLVQLLGRAGVAVPGGRIAVVCDNDFGPFLVKGIEADGGEPVLFASPAAVSPGPWDAVAIALEPVENPRLTAETLAALADRAGGAPLAQFWGDLDRAAAATLSFARIVPEVEPQPGHMGVLLSDLGHEPIVRLQCGGLAAAAWTVRDREAEPGGVAVPF